MDPALKHILRDLLHPHLFFSFHWLTSQLLKSINSILFSRGTPDWLCPEDGMQSMAIGSHIDTAYDSILIMHDKYSWRQIKKQLGFKRFDADSGNFGIFVVGTILCHDRLHGQNRRQRVPADGDKHLKPNSVCSRESKGSR
jgi:hypothetical protein